MNDITYEDHKEAMEKLGLEAASEEEWEYERSLE